MGNFAINLILLGSLSLSLIAVPAPAKKAVKKPADNNVEGYEAFHNADYKTYLQKVSALEKYIANPQNISQCQKLSEDDSGINLSYKIKFKNGFEGILKHHSTQDAIQRELASFAIAKDVSMRAVAPITSMIYKGNTCSKIPQNTKVIVSYFIKNAEHLDSVSNPNLFEKEKKKYDWFNFLVFDCDHETHNILKQTGNNTDSYLFDYDWSFSYPSEIQASQTGDFVNWCNSYLSVMPRQKETKEVSKKRSELFCSKFPSFLRHPTLLSKVKNYAKGIFPKAVDNLNDFRKKAFIYRAGVIVDSASQCKK